MKKKLHKYKQNRITIQANNGIIASLESRMRGERSVFPTGEIKGGGPVESYEELLHKKDTYIEENERLKKYNKSVEVQLKRLVETNKLSNYDFKLIEMVVFNDIGFDSAALSMNKNTESVRMQYYRTINKL